MAIEEYLIEKFKSKRPPEVSAKVLALVIELHRRGEPFPLRAHVAHDLNCSKFGVDAALNMAMARDLVVLKVTIQESLTISHRPAVTQHRFFIPSRRLIAASGQAQSPSPSSSTRRAAAQ